MIEIDKLTILIKLIKKQTKKLKLIISSTEKKQGGYNQEVGINRGQYGNEIGKDILNNNGKMALKKGVLGGAICDQPPHWGVLKCKSISGLNVTLVQPRDMNFMGKTTFI